MMLILSNLHCKDSIDLLHIAEQHTESPEWIRNDSMTQWSSCVSFIN